MPTRNPGKDISGIAHLFPEQTWKVNERGLPDSECRICRGGVFWKNRAKKYLCATCHPPPNPSTVREWVGIDADDDELVEEPQVRERECEFALSGDSGADG
jgi:hypothetical protein